MVLSELSQRQEPRTRGWRSWSALPLEARDILQRYVRRLLLLPLLTCWLVVRQRWRIRLMLLSLRFPSSRTSSFGLGDLYPVAVWCLGEKFWGSFMNAWVLCLTGVMSTGWTDKLGLSCYAFDTFECDHVTATLLKQFFHIATQLQGGHIRPQVRKCRTGLSRCRRVRSFWCTPRRRVLRLHFSMRHR